MEGDLRPASKVARSIAIVFLAYIQLYNAVHLDPERFRAVYEKRLAMAKNCTSIMKAWIKVRPSVSNANMWAPVRRSVLEPKAADIVVE